MAGIFAVAFAAFNMFQKNAEADSAPQTKKGVDLSPAQAEQAIRADSAMVILDVRTPEEYRSETGHLRGAILIPVQELAQRLNELDRYKNRPMVVYCRIGHRSKRAQGILESHGFRAANMTGGITQWNDEHRPVVQEGAGNLAR